MTFAGGSLFSALLVIVALLPFTQMLILAARSEGTGEAVPRSLLLFATSGSLNASMRDSALVAFSVTVSGIGLASVLAYAISRLRLRRGARSVSQIWLVSPLLPSILLLLLALAPLVTLHLLPIYAVALALYGITAWPFCVWQLQRQYDAIPLSTEEAARLDGCSKAQAFYRLILPLSARTLCCTALFSFLASWTLCGVARALFAEWNEGGAGAVVQCVILAISILWPLYAAGWILRRQSSARASA